MLLLFSGHIHWKQQAPCGCFNSISSHDFRWEHIDCHLFLAASKAFPQNQGHARSALELGNSLPLPFLCLHLFLYLQLFLLWFPHILQFLQLTPCSSVKFKLAPLFYITSMLSTVLKIPPRGIGDPPSWESSLKKKSKKELKPQKISMPHNFND